MTWYFLHSWPGIVAYYEEVPISNSNLIQQAYGNIMIRKRKQEICRDIMWDWQQSKKKIKKELSPQIIYQFLCDQHYLW